MLKTFSLQGRLGRLRYFLISVIVVAMAAITISALSRLQVSVGTRQGASTLQGLLALTSVLAVIAYICLMVRRLHDFDQSGWWTLSVLVLYLVQGYYEAADNRIAAIITGILLLVVHLAVILTPGSKNPNRFGNVPGSTTAPV